MTDPFEGYKHAEFVHCPKGRQWQEGHCSCNPNDSFGAKIRHDLDLDDTEHMAQISRKIRA
jgi:hypothetical protein